MSVDDRLDALFEDIDSLCSRGELEAVGEKLRKFDPQKEGVDLTVGMLCITLPVKDMIPDRQDFVERARRFFEQRCPQDVRSLLDGLE
jgi:hypothetical protein